MITREEWVDIISLHRQGLSIRAISARLGISRNTVRAALRRQGPPARQERALPSKLDPYKDYLLARLADYPELSAAALLDEIRALGYAGGLSILKEFTYPYRQRRRQPVVRFETAPGQQAQADWSSLGRHLLGDEHRSPQLYDNAKVVVLERLAAGPRYNPGLLDFAGRYGFAPRLCRPYRARTKGKVERSIGYLKDRFFVGRVFADLEDLNCQLLGWLDAVANRREHATTNERPIDRLSLEKLSPLPATPWAAELRREQRAPHHLPTAPEVAARPLAVYEALA